MSDSDAIYTPMGSKGIITGPFAVIEYAKGLLKNYDSVVMGMLHQHAQDEQNALRKAASESDTGWAEIADALTVSYNHTKSQFQYRVDGDEETSQKAMDLEYGNLSTPPNPLIRTHILNTQMDKEAAFNKKLRSKFLKKFA